MTTIGLSYSLVKISTKCAPALITQRLHISPEVGIDMSQKYPQGDRKQHLEIKAAEYFLVHD